MQDASADFATAVEKGEVTWSRPQVLADWLDDGATTLSSGQPACVLDRFDNRDSSSTWTRPKLNVPSKAYVHSGGANSDYTIPGGLGYARFGFAAVNATRRAFIETASNSMLAYTRWSTSADLTGTGEATFDLVCFDAGPDTDHYAVRMEVDVSNDTIDLKLMERSGGSLSTLLTLNDQLTYVFGHVYNMLIQVNVDELLLRAKVWDEDIETEPVEWQLEHTIVSLVAGGTNAGLRCTMPSTITTATPLYVHFLEFRVIDGSIDDLSDLAGQITISHTLDDGLPGEVSFIQDQGTAILDAQITDGRQGLTAMQYLSQFRTDSPLYGLARDVAPVTVDHGVVTDSGVERLRLFTGRMVDVPLSRDRIGHLTAMSDTRLKLSKPVQPPPFNRIGDLSATWPISWSCYQCGVYAAPPPADGCVFYMPMHGSMQPFLDSTQPTSVSMRGVFAIGDSNFLLDRGGRLTWELTAGGIDESFEPLTPPYVDGPYVAAPDLLFTSTLARGVAVWPMFFAFGEDMLSEAGPRGRVEFAVRGDDFDATPPSGSDLAPADLIIGVLIQSDSDTDIKVYAGINMSRQATIIMGDGTVVVTHNATGLDLPTDGEWYKYGIAWDFAAETAYFYKRDPDGTEHTDSVTSVSWDVTRLPAEDDIFGIVEPFNGAVLLETLSPYFHAFLPFAELHMTSGTGANPNNAPWIWEDAYEWTQGAIIKPSSTRLRAIAEVTEREAWELIGSYAQSEMASTRINEQDQFMYLTPAYWVQEDQQTQGQVLSTETNVGQLVPQVDPSKIRNSVSVRYQELRLNGPFHTPIYQSREVLALPPGTTRLLIPLDVLATEIDTALATLPSAAEIANGVSDFIGASWTSFFTINTEDDGSGTYYTGPSNPFTDPVYIQTLDVFTAGLVTVEVVNQSGATVFTVNTNPEVPTISIGGIGVRQFETSVTAERADSIARRGYRGLVVDSVHQRREDATRLAQRLVGELADPVITAEDVTLFADPRRQPGDLVELVDPHDTRISGNWRLLSVRHVIDGANYTQTGRLRQARVVGEWQESGSSRWGQALWGREGY